MNYHRYRVHSENSKSGEVIDFETPSQINLEPDLLIKKLQDNGAKYVDNEVVVSGKIVTGNGPSAASAFAKTVYETIGL